MLRGSTVLWIAIASATLACIPTAAADPVDVDVQIHLISFGNYDTSKGTYVMDLYLVFSYDTTTAPAGFDIDRFEFMNGRAASKERLSDETVDGVREVWYRIQANLYSRPQFADYPFDTQTLRLDLEDGLYPIEELRYVTRDAPPLGGDVAVAGWRIQEVNTTTTPTEYSWGETYSRVRFSMVIDREPVSTAMRSFLPPLAFMLVSGLSFFFHPSKITQRISLGTGMLISAVGFHISQIVSLPALSTMTFFDRFMISVYAFLAASLAVTTLIAIDEDHWKESDHTREINRWGAVGAIVLPFLVYVALGWV